MDIWYHRLGAANEPDTTVCDGVGRFNLSDSSKPAWINYTGGDSVWSVSDTGAAVYVAGHFRWLDNPDGWKSLGLGDKTSGAPAASRRGIGAIDPASGLANGWNPGLTATSVGGKALGGRRGRTVDRQRRSSFQWPAALWARLRAPPLIRRQHVSQAGRPQRHLRTFRWVSPRSVETSPLRR